MERLSPACVVAAAAVLWLSCATSGDRASFDGGPPDAVFPPPDASMSGSCDPALQMGCDSGSKCTFRPSGDGHLVVGCVAGDGDRLPGESCTGPVGTAPDDCEAGSYCDGGTGVCVAFCHRAPSDTCVGDTVCAVDYDGDGDGIIEAMLCSSTCDPLAQDCAQVGDGCYPSRFGPICAAAGGGETPAGLGEPCSFANHCELGLGCFRIGTESDWLCLELCDADVEGACGAPLVCNRVEDEPWGLCVTAG